VSLRGLLLVACASVIHCGALLAQDVAALRVGARVRVSSIDSTCTRRWRPCDSRALVGGTLVRVTPDTLVLQDGPETTLAVARHAGQRVFVSQGRSRLRSAIRSGLLQGLVSFAIADVTDASQRSTVRVASAFAAGGFALGALLPMERWRRARE
jgi:hypothetical protein